MKHVWKCKHDIPWMRLDHSQQGWNGGAPAPGSRVSRLPTARTGRGRGHAARAAGAGAPASTVGRARVSEGRGTCGVLLGAANTHTSSGPPRLWRGAEADAPSGSRTAEQADTEAAEDGAPPPPRRWDHGPGAPRISWEMAITVNGCSVHARLSMTSWLDLL